ncbi:uncharacterized protein LOC141912579 [Tubulanus polymorphus]|uniref:uncharacterized protein LOC141912579 n=1 Tax=Tubulanus polymorphus TaxID=672921 RepID=UPI003DA483B4
MFSGGRYVDVFTSGFSIRRRDAWSELCRFQQVFSGVSSTEPTSIMDKMDFSLLLTLAQGNQKDKKEQSKREPRKFSTVVPPPKKESKTQKPVVAKDAIKSLLEKKKQEEKAARKRRIEAIVKKDLDKRNKGNKKLQHDEKKEYKLDPDELFAKQHKQYVEQKYTKDKLNALNLQEKLLRIKSNMIGGIPVIEKEEPPQQQAPVEKKDRDSEKRSRDSASSKSSSHGRDHKKSSSGQIKEFKSRRSRSRSRSPSPQVDVKKSVAAKDRTKTKRPPPPAVLSFDDLMKMAQDKSASDGKAAPPDEKKEKEKKKPEIPRPKGMPDRPMTQDEKEHWLRKQTKEYQDWIRHGKERPQFEIVNNKRRRPKYTTAGQPLNDGRGPNFKSRERLPSASESDDELPDPNASAGAGNTASRSNSSASKKDARNISGSKLNSSVSKNVVRNSNSNARNSNSNAGSSGSSSGASSKNNSIPAKSSSKFQTASRNGHNISAQDSRKTPSSSKIAQNNVSRPSVDKRSGSTPNVGKITKKIHLSENRERSVLSKTVSNRSTSSSGTKGSNNNSKSRNSQSESRNRQKSSQLKNGSSARSNDSNRTLSGRGGASGRSDDRAKAIAKKNSYAEENDNVLVCRPAAAEEPLNPWDRIYGEIQRNRPVKRRHVEDEYDDEDDYYDEEDDFIDDEDDNDSFIDDGPIGGQEDISSVIKQIFKYDKRKYRDEDEDLSCMEASFAQQMKEEARSARLGREEDLEDIRREEEELKRRKMLLMKKKMKTK